MTSSKVAGTAARGPALAPAPQRHAAESAAEQQAAGRAALAAPAPFQLLGSDDASGVCAVDGTCS